MITLATTDIRKLNSLTKYPSIPTYHTMNSNYLENSHLAFSGEVIGTEKIDGVNGRIVFLPDGDYIIGTREELIFAKGDRIPNPELRVVEALEDLAERLTDLNTSVDSIYTLYLEVFGGRTTQAARNYTGHEAISYRLFDATITLDADIMLLSWPIEKFSGWRERDTSRFLSDTELQTLAEECDIPLVPRLFSIEATELPDTIDTALAFLVAHTMTTLVGIDDGARGKSEGLVIRSPDRSMIAKLRFEDYQRTLRKRG